MGVERRAQRDAGRRVDGDHGHVADALFRDEPVHDADTQPLLHHGQNGVVVLGGKFDVRAHPRIVQRPVDIVG